MKKDLVSIITPMYQAERYLGAAIESVIAQDYPEWELFIVDDGSTDSSLAIAEKYAKEDKRITVIKNIGPSRSGAAYCRNLAMKFAHGQYISFIDSDDVWDNDFLSSQVAFAKKTGCPFVYSSYRRWTPRKTDNYLVPTKVTYQSILKTNPITCLTVLIDAEAIGLPLMPENALYREDIACFYQLLRAKTPFALGNPEILATYRLHIGSVSYNKWKMIKYEWRLFHKVEKLNFCKSLFYMFHWVISGLKYYHNLNRRPLSKRAYSSLSLEVLVTTMNKSVDDIIALYRKMNLSGPAIFGNQCGKDSLTELTIDGHLVKILNQSSIGVSRNRNAILKLASADLVVFMDDDVVMADDYRLLVDMAFSKKPRATSIRFNMVTHNEKRPIRQHRNSWASYRDIISYGVWGLVIKRQTLLKKKLAFNESFGPGATFYCGEDSMFSKDLFLKTRRNYDRKEVLGTVEQEESTWFKEHDEKFFVSQGAMYYHLGGPIIRWYFIIVMLRKHRSYIKMPMKTAKSFVRIGIKQARQARSH